MAKVNWYIAAKSSEIEEVKELVAEYDKKQDKEEKKLLRDKIIIILTPKSTVEPKENTENEDSGEVEQTLEEKAFKDKLDKIKVLRKEMEELEHTRLKHGSYEENKDLNAKIKGVSKQIVAIRQELRNDRIAKKKEEMRKNGIVSSIRVKQIKLLKMLRDGLSFTQIVKHSDGIELKEICSIVENNHEFMEELEKINRKLPLIWLRWKQKFIIVKR